MKDIISLILSTVAITISAITAWLTLFKKGKLKMTQPTPLLLSYEKGKAKISFYTMFYSTAFRGQVIENMYILFDQNGETLPFNKWAYSSESNVFAAGCYIKPEGIAQNHQFYVTDNNFFFQPGSIRINVYAKFPNKKKQSHLKCIHLQIPKEKKSICEDKTKGLMFEWEPESSRREDYSLPPLTEPCLRISRTLCVITHKMRYVKATLMLRSQGRILLFQYFWFAAFT